MQMMQEIYGKVREEYRKHLTSKLLLVDALLVFAFATGIIQVLPTFLRKTIAPSLRHVDVSVCLYGAGWLLPIQLLSIGLPLLHCPLLTCRCTLHSLPLLHLAHKYSCNSVAEVSDDLCRL